MQSRKVADLEPQNTTGLDPEITTQDLLEAKITLEEIKKILRRPSQHTDIKEEIK